LSTLDVVRDHLPLRVPELHERLRAGHAVQAGAIAGRNYRGTSLGLWPVIEAVTWKSFRKCFHADVDGTVRGWNVRLAQDGIEAPSRPLRRRDGRSRAFGHFVVRSAKGAGVPGGAEQGLLLDYGLGGHRRLDPTGLLRDPLVAVREGDASVLLGWSYLAIGAVRLRTPSFFLLVDDGPLVDVEPRRR